MMSATDLSVRSLQFALGLIEQMTADLTAAELVHRPCDAANCAAWIVGHLVLSKRGMLKQLEGTPKTVLPEGFESRYSQKENAPQAKDFEDTGELLPLLKATTAELMTHIESLSQDFLTQAMAKPHPIFKTRGDLVALAPVHLAVHTGQLSTIRRSLGKPPLF